MPTLLPKGGSPSRLVLAFLALVITVSALLLV